MMIVSRPELWGWSTGPLTIAFWGWEDSRGLLRPHRGCIPAITHTCQAQRVLKCWPSASAAVHFDSPVKFVQYAGQGLNAAGQSSNGTPCITSSCSRRCGSHTAKALVNDATGKVIKESHWPLVIDDRLHIGSHASIQQAIPRVSK